MKKLILILALCICGATSEVHAQKFLKNLKDKTGTLVDKAGTAVRDLDITNNKSGKKNTQDKAPSSVSTDEGESEDALVKGLYKGNIGEDAPYTVPKVTASTAKVTVKEDTRSLSNFFDGVAYICDANNAFYIDKKGNRLFDTDYMEQYFVKILNQKIML